jgi:hypothetical protein
MLPKDVLDQIPQLKRICDPIIAILPNITEYISRSTFSQVAELVLCLGWLIAPLNFIFVILLSEPVTLNKIKQEADRLQTNVTSSAIASIIFIFVLPLAVWALVTIPLFGPDSGAEVTDYSYNYRFVFAIVGQGMSNFVGVYCAIWVILIVRILPLYFRK